MESKISIETNDNFQNFLLLALSEFESKKIQEDLDKVKKIDENHYLKKLEIESLRKIVKDYHKDSREKDNNVGEIKISEIADKIRNLKTDKNLSVFFR